MILHAAFCGSCSREMMDDRDDVHISCWHPKQGDVSVTPQRTSSSVAHRSSTALSSIRFVVSTSTAPAPSDLHFSASCSPAPAELPLLHMTTDCVADRVLGSKTFILQRSRVIWCQVEWTAILELVRACLHHEQVSAVSPLTSFNSSSERATSTRFACSFAYASAIAAPWRFAHS